MQLKKWGHLAGFCLARPLFVKTIKKIYHLAKTMNATEISVLFASLAYI